MPFTHRELKEQCRAKGLVLTPQRWAVYEALMAMCGHPGVDAVYQKVRRTAPAISLATVYTALGWLERNGFAASVPARDNARRYDTVDAPHHHLICVKCGGITDTGEVDARKAVPPSIARRYEVVGCSVTVNIICPRCKGGAKRKRAGK